MSTPKKREHTPRLKLRLAALKRHAAARGPDGKSELTVAAEKASGRPRQGDRAWALDMGIRAGTRRTELAGSWRFRRCPACKHVRGAPLGWYVE